MVSGRKFTVYGFDLLPYDLIAKPVFITSPELADRAAAELWLAGVSPVLVWEIVPHE